MKYLMPLIALILLDFSVISQTKSKPAPKPQGTSEVDKTMKELEKMMEQMDPETRKMMKDALNKQQSGKLAEPLLYKDLKIPAKQSARIASMPKLKTKEQLATFIDRLLDALRKKMTPGLVQSIDFAFDNHKSDTSYIGNLPIVLFTERKPLPALYAAAKATKSFSSIPIIQSNLSVLLHQNGYAELAVPVLKNIDWSVFSSPIPFINLGYFYITLGDTTESLEIFRKGLEKYPKDPELHCGVAFIKDQNGNKKEAVKHIKEAFHGGFSPFMQEYFDPKKKLFKWPDVRQEPAQIFKANVFKPIPPATNVEEEAGIYAARDVLSKQMLVSHERGNALQEKIEIQDKNADGKTMFDRHMYDFTRKGFAMKGEIMYELLMEDAIEKTPARTELGNQHLKRLHEITELYEKNSEKANHLETVDERCQGAIRARNEYLLASAENYSNYVRKTYNDKLEFWNQVVYLQSFFLKGDYLENFYANAMEGLQQDLIGYHGYQAVLSNNMSCIEDITTDTSKSLQSFDMDENGNTLPGCPAKYNVDIGLLNMKADCESIEFEMGEGAIGGFDLNFISGEFGLFLGVGASSPKLNKIGGLEIAENIKIVGKEGIFVKGQIYDEKGPNGKPGMEIIDIGIKGEVGGEMKIGSFVSEGKFTGIIGATSGSLLEGSAMGQKKTLFENNFWKDL